MGQSYYCFIPAQKYNNSSPSFQGIPTPYICAGDSLSISYAATDIDGDSLVYSFVHPHAGGTEFNPAPSPSSFLGLPIVEVNFFTGFSFMNPFGSNGISFINSKTGLVTIRVPQAGLYAIAVEVKEYRNGILISSIRRDIELIVINCPPNDIPKLRIPGNVTKYEVEEGDYLEFDIPYTDNKDSMYLTRTGGIFGGASAEIPAPYARLDTVSGIGRIETTFKWQTSCNHGRANPYFFNVKVQDNGCPDKTAINIFEIKVNPFDGPDSISGPRQACAFSTNNSYKAHGVRDSSTLSWTVIGGNLIAGQGTDSIVVKWLDEGTGIVRVAEINKFGCGPEVASKNVIINPLPPADAGPDQTFCSGDTINLGKLRNDSNLIHLWTPNTYLINDDSSITYYTKRNIGVTPESQKLYLKVSNQFGCIKNDSVEITINPEPDTVTISGPSRPCYQGAIDYSAPAILTSSFFWNVEGGSILSGGNTNEIVIHWTDTASGSIWVVEQNNYGCFGDTSRKDVIIVRPEPKIIGPDVVCPNTVNVEYYTKKTKQSLYRWNVDNGVRTDKRPFDNKITVNWPDSGLAAISLVEITKEGCVSDSVIFPVLISYRLKTSEIFGDTFVCEFEMGKPYKVIRTNGSYYDWNVDGGNISYGQGKDSMQVDWGTQGLALISVLETSYDSVNDKACIGDTVFQPVIINPKPKTTPINGPVHVCEMDTHTYFVNGFGTSFYFWSIDDPDIQIQGNLSNQITVSWNKPGTYNMQIVELSQDSCAGDIIDTTIVVHPLPVTSVIFGDSTICFPSNTDVPYSVNGYSNSVFNWDITGGLITENNDNKIKVTWTDVPHGYLEVQEVSEWGCIGDLIEKEVVVDSLKPVIELVTTLPQNEEIISVEWKVVNDFHYNRKTELYKANGPWRSWTLIDSFPKSITSYLDSNVSTDENAYSYIISVKNVCSDRFESKPHQSILLAGEKDGEWDIELNWNAYRGWEEGVKGYNIYRSINHTNDYNLLRESLTDTFVKMTVGIDGMHQCYRIVAEKNSSQVVQSWSNSICFEYEPVLQIPNAFTPNGDGVNDTFGVLASNITVFKMTIYNRWGQKLFETSNPNSGWDGTHNGADCPMDAYLMIVQYEGATPMRRITKAITLIR
jgi:gliding motility-associated-like protein